MVANTAGLSELCLTVDDHGLASTAQHFFDATLFRIIRAVLADSVAKLSFHDEGLFGPTERLGYADNEEEKL